MMQALMAVVLSVYMAGVVIFIAPPLKDLNEVPCQGLSPVDEPCFQAKHPGTLFLKLLLSLIPILGVGMVSLYVSAAPPTRVTVWRPPSIPPRPWPAVSGQSGEPKGVPCHAVSEKI